jgi:uncharacterized protein YecE (DUF72 family)
MTVPEGRIRVGTAAWSDHVDFYPKGTKPGDRISYYAQHFSVVEVNASYYHIMPAHNYALWVDKTPDDFQFNVKAFGQLTGHVRDQPATRETFDLFRESYAPLRESGKLAAVLFGFPPWFNASDENRQQIAECVESMADDPLLVEFRNTSWLAPEQRDETLEFLRDLGVSYVTVDAPQIGNGTAQRVVAVTNQRLGYLRLHGRNRETWYKRVESTGERFNYLYNQREITELAGDALELAREATLVHVIFNNNMQNYAVTNARMMVEALGAAAYRSPHAGPQQADLGI